MTDVQFFHTIPPTGKKREQISGPSALVQDLATGLMSTNPYSESTTGLSTIPSANSKKAQQLQEMEEYEENYMRRLFMSKRDRKRRVADEENVALGQGSSGKSRGGFTELDDFVGQLEKSRKRSGNDYQNMRTFRRSLDDKASEGDSAQKNGQPTRNKFEQAIKRQRRRQH